MFLSSIAASILVPTGADQAQVCGNDIALLVLTTNVSLPRYAVPTCAPPMTQHPTYDDGRRNRLRHRHADRTWGARRQACAASRERPALLHPRRQDHPRLPPRTGRGAGDDRRRVHLGRREHLRGDSGSSVFDQANFDAGEWVAYGVLSRGAVSADGKTCVQPIYTRFDAWERSSSTRPPADQRRPPSGPTRPASRAAGRALEGGVDGAGPRGPPVPAGQLRRDSTPGCASPCAAARAASATRRGLLLPGRRRATGRVARRRLRALARGRVSIDAARRSRLWRARAFWPSPAGGDDFALAPAKRRERERGRGASPDCPREPFRGGSTCRDPDTSQREEVNFRCRNQGVSRALARAHGFC